MKKFLGILAVFAIGLLIFGVISKSADANRNIFDKGTPDELENAKQISLGILRDRAAQRAIGNPDQYEVKRVELDSVKMAHTHVRQTVEGVPVWEGEAIVHLKQDGELSVITDDLKEGIAVNTKPNLSAE